MCVYIYIYMCVCVCVCMCIYIYTVDDEPTVANRTLLVTSFRFPHLHACRYGNVPIPARVQVWERPETSSSSS